MYFEHQGEDEADWAYDEEPADDEVAANFFFKRFTFSKSGFSSAGW